ncbi:MAG TPA: hypothetical protein VKN14_01735 [Flavobacteriaceae bacterium]|nr:hypothetical protein [Flavobacteriaceae bacterium]
MSSKFFGNKSEQPSKKKDKGKSRTSNVVRKLNIKKSGRGK